MKIPIEVIDLELEKMWQEGMKIDPNDHQKIEEHCRLVENFLDACGISTEDYIRHMMGFDKADAFN